MSAAQDDMEVATKRFLTGSSYEGAWNHAVHMMDGFGSYRFPDGSEYRGRFVQGKFHGYGHLKLAQPYRFTIKGEFDKGKLVSIEDMWFSDGLHVQGSFKNGNFNCDDWNYLTRRDRRYQAERFYGQQPVGPTSYLTSNLMERKVPKDCFDVEEGIFNSKTGWLVDRPQPFSKSVFINCPNEKKWIMRHCRGAHKEHIIEPPPEFCRQIIGNNLATEETQLPNITIYAPNKDINRDRYYPKFYKENPEPDRQTADFLFAAKRPWNTPVTTTEVCIKRHYVKEQERVKEFTKWWKRNHPKEPMPSIEKARQWTSSSEPENVDSGPRTPSLRVHRRCRSLRM